MKKPVIKAIFNIFIFVFNVTLIHGQVLEIKEIPATGKKNYEVKNLATSYVDINSSFSINIKKDSLRKCIGNDLIKDNISVQSLLDELSNLQNISSKLLVASEKFIRAYQNYALMKSDSSLARMTEAISALAYIELDISRSIRKTPWVYNRENELLQTGQNVDKIFQILLGEMQERLKKQCDSVMGKQGVYIQLGAWLICKDGNVSIHLDGFDEYPLGTYYEYKNINLQLDSNQTKELAAMNKALNNNAKSYSDIFQTLASSYATVFSDLFDPIHDSINSILKQLEAIKVTGKTELKNIQPEIDTVIKSFQEYLPKLSGFFINIKNLSFKEPDKIKLVKQLFAECQDIIGSTRSLIQENKTRISLVLKTLDNAKISLKNNVQTLVTSCTSLYDLVNKQLNSTNNVLNDLVFGKQFNSDLLEFGDKVHKLSMDSIPSSTYFSLKYTGKRNPNDQVIIKIAGGTTSMKKPKDIEVYYLSLIEAEPHINMAIAYDFAWPVSGIQTVPKNGPSYSMLYKFRSRNPIYRNVIDIGVGLNFATFDFNKDDVPEIAAGVCISALRDYLMGGWGFNFNANIGYFYAGIRIPLTLNSISFGTTKTPNQ